MTEAIHTLPGRAPGARPAPVPGSRPVPARTAGSATTGLVLPNAVARTGVATRRPVHVVVAVGMTAGLYAISLAGVAMLQSASDLQLAADRAPAADALAGLKSAHDAMELSLGTLSGAYAQAADGYKGIAQGIVGHEQALAALGQQVQAATGSAAALSVPVFSLEPARPSGPASAYAPPAARMSGSAAAAPVSAGPAPKLAPLPVVSVSAPVVSKPAVNACTTASGKPC
jgi:hypothetical protein